MAQLLRPDPWRFMNYPLYVPVGDALDTLAKSGPRDFVADLKRRAELGAAWAAAALGFIELRGGIDGKVDLANAERFCRQPADAGDPYAQYVLAWIALTQRRGPEALEWMERAAGSNFSPACADLGRFHLGGVGSEASDVNTGISMLWRAHRLGHKAALLFICDTYRRGRCGHARRLVGYFLSPLAFARYYFALATKPFSEKVFVVDNDGAKLPLFRRTT